MEERLREALALLPESTEEERELLEEALERFTAHATAQRNHQAALALKAQLQERPETAMEVAQRLLQRHGVGAAVLQSK